MRSIIRTCGQFLAMTFAAAAGALAQVPYDIPAACTFGVGQCKNGFVWREANSLDHVCAPGPARDRVRAENDQSPGRTNPDGRCQAPFTKRLANRSDTACVTPQEKSLANTENAAAAARIDPKCTVAAVCKFHCDAQQRDCENIHDGRNCKRERARCLQSCKADLGLNTPH